MTDTRKRDGDDAETLAVHALERAGYRIVDRNYRCRAGELDIVARDGNTLVFVEVRSRADSVHGSALASVTSRKQRQVVKVAKVYLKHRKPVFDDCRFDVIGITAGELTHVKGAFRS